MKDKIVTMKEVNLNVMLIGGILLVILAFYKLFWVKRKYKMSNIAEGVVFKVEKEINRSGNEVTYIVVRFLTLEKVWITERLEDSVLPNIFKNGERIKVIYNADEPKKFIVVSAKQRTFYYSILFLGFFLIAVVFFRLF